MNIIGHTGAASLLVLRLTSVPFDADEETISEYFAGYELVDQIRSINPQTQNLSTIYVMFASVQERNRAYSNLHSGTILGRRIYLMPAHLGNYRVNDTHDSFIHDDEQQNEVAIPEPAAFKGLSSSDFPPLAIPAPPSFLPVSNLPNQAAAHLRTPNDGSVEVADDSGRVEGIAFHQGLSEWLKDMPHTLQDHYLNFPLPPPNTSSKLDVNNPPNPHFPREEGIPVEHTPQPEDSRTYNTQEPSVPLLPLGGLWNLSENADPAANFVSESAWYNFMSDIEMEE